MDKLELLKLGLGFIEKIVASLAWPLVVLIIAVMFKEKFTRLLDEISEWKGWGVEAKFARGAREALKQAEEVANVEAPATQPPAQPPVQQVPIPMSEPDGEAKDPIVRPNRLMTYSHPGAAILLAWANVEEALRLIVSERGLYMPAHATGTFTELLTAIMKAELLSEEQFKLLMKIKTLRNGVAHSETQPTPEAAEDYIVATSKLVRTLRRIAKAKT